MKSNHLNYQVALTLLNGIGAKNAKTLLAYLGNEQAVFDKSLNIRTKIPGFAKEKFRALNREEALEKARQIVDFTDKHGIDTVFFSDKKYPRRLRECADSPVLLYHHGDFDMNPPKNISIVGTRNITTYGKQLINELLSAIAPYHVQVISGLALGVDGYVHQKCLELGIPTIGVLGHGLDRIYPHLHRGLAKEMIQTKGSGIITEFPNGTTPDRENFPQRNRIVAGLTDATIVIESGEKGGSLITANLANDYNRDVFAFPGDISRPYSKGCNQLIANNKAHLITNGADLIRLLEWKLEKEKSVSQTNLFENLNGEEKSIVQTIVASNKIPLEILALKLEKPINLLSSVLLGLELKGIIMALPGKHYALSNP